MKIKHLIVTVLLFVLASVLIMGYVDHLEQTRLRERTKTLVVDAAVLLEDKGEEVFPEFREKGTKWFQDETYVFIWKTDGIRVVYPPNLSGEGQNMSNLVDVTGKAIGRLFIDIALSEEGEGWIDYRWPKPGETVPSVKHTYIKGVDTGEKAFIVGSGFYLDTANNTLQALRYAIIMLGSIIAVAGLLISIRQKRFFGYGIFLTFIIYICYDITKIIPLEISGIVLYSLVLVATMTMLWSIILIYQEKIQDPKTSTKKE